MKKIFKNESEFRQTISDFADGMKVSLLRPRNITGVGIQVGDRQAGFLTKDVYPIDTSLSITSPINNETEAQELRLILSSHDAFLKAIHLPVRAYTALLTDTNILKRVVSIFISEVSSKTAWSILHKDNTIYGLYPRVYPYLDPVKVYTTFADSFKEYSFYCAEVDESGDFVLYLNKGEILSILKFSPCNNFAPYFSFGYVNQNGEVYDFESFGTKVALTKEKFEQSLEQYSSREPSFEQITQAVMSYVEDLSSVLIPEFKGGINVNKIKYFGRRMGFPNSTIASLLDNYSSNDCQPTEFNLKILLKDLFKEYMAEEPDFTIPAKVGKFITTSRECTRLGDSFIGKDDLSVDKLKQLAYRK